MIDHSLSIPLPSPWGGEEFQTLQIGAINFLVGPNGSGKSQFAHTLAGYLPGVRMLGTDRLIGMEQIRPFTAFQSDPFNSGYAKNRFQYLRAAGAQGSGIDTILLLEERMDLRIQVESTLNHLFSREIILEWDSGSLIAKVRRLGTGDSYRLDREECHGIKELLVLLTHLYDHSNRYLIIDEPELNLHPQYQAFFMQEVRKIAGDPNADPNKKVVFLITHSPFILDLRSTEDLKSVISFDLEYSPPKQVGNLDVDTSSMSNLMRRLNAHHKQLFFSDNPIFVEGIHDAWLVEAMMETRGLSVSGAGSCIIDAGGNDQVTHYLELCRGLGKEAHFLYDLDSLFRGRLRTRIKNDESIREFLVSAGHGSDLDDYCGTLESKLTDMVDTILANPVSPHLETLTKFLQGFGPNRHHWDPTSLPKARIAVMTAISRYRDDMVSVSKQEDIADIEGRLGQIVATLKEKNIHLLSGGTIERYLPHYEGDEYRLSNEAKQKAVLAEIEEMSNLTTKDDLSNRYGELYDVVCTLPSKDKVDLDAALRNHLSRYIHEVQRAVVDNPNWQADQIRQRLSSIQPSWNGVFSIKDFTRTPESGFKASIGIIPMLGQEARFVSVSNHTNAGMGDFTIELDPTPSEGTP